MNEQSNPVPTLTQTCRFLSNPDLDGRAPGTEGHERALQYLLNLFKPLNFGPLFGGSWTQPILDGASQIGTNLGGLWRGRTNRTILLGAHYDHFQGIPGADDNAAALSILIETAKQLKTWSGDHSIVLCFFDLEEPPYFRTDRMGSMYFAAHAPFDLRSVECAIILDLCGHDVAVPGQEDAVFLLGAETSPDLVQAIRGVRSPPLPVCMFDNARVGDMSDHHAFRLREIPFLFFTCGQWEHYHRPSDTFEKLNLSKMQRLADYLVLLIRALDRQTTTWNPVREFWRVEAKSLEHLAGQMLPSSKEFVDQTIGHLLRSFS